MTHLSTDVGIGASTDWRNVPCVTRSLDSRLMESYKHHFDILVWSGDIEIEITSSFKITVPNLRRLYKLVHNCKAKATLQKALLFAKK